MLKRIKVRYSSEREFHASFSDGSEELKHQLMIEVNLQEECQCSRELQELGYCFEETAEGGYDG
eukprot:13153743-Ditylum_brightwellii.AAC.1